MEPCDPVLAAYLLFAHDLSQFVLAVRHETSYPPDNLAELGALGGHLGKMISAVAWVECKPEYQEKVKAHIGRIKKTFDSKKLLPEKKAYLVSCSLGKEDTWSDSILLAGIKETPGENCGARSGCPSAFTLDARQGENSVPALGMYIWLTRKCRLRNCTKRCAQVVDNNLPFAADLSAFSSFVPLAMACSLSCGPMRCLITRYGKTTSCIILKTCTSGERAHSGGSRGKWTTSLTVLKLQKDAMLPT